MITELEDSLKSKAKDKKKFFKKIVKLQPLLKEFNKFLNNQQTEQLKKLIKICEEYDVKSWHDICISFEALDSFVSDNYGLVKELCLIKNSIAFKFRGLLSHGYWAITKQKNLNMHAGND